MKSVLDIEVLFVAGFGPIVWDTKASNQLYIDTLGLPLRRHETNAAYFHTDKIEGVKEFALWPLEQAAESCFGTKVWPDKLPIPQAWLELDVADIAKATNALKSKGYTLLVALRKEPWGQTVTRFLSPEGILVAISYSPWLRK